MPPLPFLPDDVLSEIIVHLAPPPPLSMSSQTPSLLSEVLEVYRPPPISAARKDLMNFWKSSKRFKALTDRKIYSYITVCDHHELVGLAQQLAAWNLAGSSIPSLVVGLAIQPFLHPGTLITSLHPNYVLFHSLPNLLYLDLGGASPSNDTLLALVTSRPALRSLVGLGVTPTSFHASTSLLSILSATLQHLNIVVIEFLKYAVPQQAVQPRIVLLPVLRSFEYVPRPDSGNNDSQVIAQVFRTPSLLSLNSAITEGKDMGLAEARDLLWSLGSPSATEFTFSLFHFGDDRNRRRMVAETPNLHTVVLQLGLGVWFWATSEGEAGVPVPSIRTVVLCQEPTQPDLEDIGRIAYKLPKILGRSALPSLERICYVTHEEGGSVWNVWARVSVGLIESGVKVEYF